MFSESAPCYNSSCRLSWDLSSGEDTLVFNPADVPKVALSGLLFDAKKHFKAVMLVDDFLEEDDHVKLLKRHLFMDVQRLHEHPHLVIGYALHNNKVEPQSQ